MVSSNVFASGSNQNSGNMMTGRSSTRRIAAPGGNSSFSLGWGGGSGGGGGGGGGRNNGGLDLPPSNTNKNYSNSSSFSHNYNQNVGNRIRDNVTGYQPLQKGSNYTIGKAQNYSTNPTANYNNANSKNSFDIRQNSKFISSNMPSAGTKSGTGLGNHRLGAGRPQLQRTEQPKYQPTYESTHAISSNAYANGSNQNCGNVMTGRSSTRIHAPPGGHTQWSLG